MTITPTQSSRTSLSPGRRSANTAEGGRFSKLLKKGECSENKAPKGDVPNRAQEARLDPPSESANSLAIGGVTAVSAGNSGQNEGLQFAGSAAPLPQELEALTSELSAQLELVTQSSATQDLNITFQSEALAGLRVQLRQAGGEVNIRFVTHVPHISGLLRQNAGRLREKLTKKGVSVGSITVGDQVAKYRPERPLRA